MKKYFTLNAIAAMSLLASLLAGCASSEPNTPSLKRAYKKDFLIGVAVNQRQFTGEDTNGVALIKAQFNAIAPENVLKWEIVHPRPGADGYDFGPGDRYVEFGKTNGMYIVGHTLIWHSQTPRWVFQEDGGTNVVDRDTLLQRMRDHIHTVVGRYKGQIKTWDVVNEALTEDGTLRRSPWMRIIGEDYIAKAFEYAHEADPAAELRYNDFSIENERKRKGVIALVRKLQEQHVPISGLGSQTHANLNWPAPELEDAALTDLATLGLPISITELDVDGGRGRQRNQSAEVGQNGQEAASQTTNAAPIVDVQQKVAKQYSDLFHVFLKHREQIKLVTFWGVTDGDSWRRRGTPLLFDPKWQPKPAFDAVIEAAQEPKVGK